MDEKPGRVLVVDDEEMNRDMLSRRLTKYGHDVLTAVDGVEALAILETEAFDVVILDIMMPKMNGVEVLARIREKHLPTRLPVIMATAKSDTQDVVGALKLGASDYVTKPLDFPVVLARIRTQLSLKRAVDQIVLLQEDLRRRNDELAAANRVIADVNLRMTEELKDAARIQQTLLPTDLPRLERVRFAWTYDPCVELGGDILNVFRIDPETLGLYLLDVSGHGVPAALLATAVARTLTPHQAPVKRIVAEPPGYRVAAPAEVAADLNVRFAMSRETNQYFTLAYALLDLRTLELRYVRAGHPAPIRITSAGESQELGPASPGIGLLKQATFSEACLRLEPGDRVYLYSDGLTEAMNAARRQFGPERLSMVLRTHAASTLEESLKGVIAAVYEWCSPSPPDDDASILALEIARTPGSALPGR